MWSEHFTTVLPSTHVLTYRSGNLSNSQLFPFLLSLFVWHKHGIQISMWHVDSRLYISKYSTVSYKYSFLVANFTWLGFLFKTSVFLCFQKYVKVEQEGVQPAHLLDGTSPFICVSYIGTFEFEHSIVQFSVKWVYILNVIC